MADCSAAQPVRPPAMEGTEADGPEVSWSSLKHSVTKLSFIPEKERAVAHRFTLVLCGDDAMSLSKRLCTSDAIEEYRPQRRLSRESVDLPGLVESDSEKNTLFGGKKSGGSDESVPMLQDEFTTLFVPMSQHLCRVRFVPVDTFSTSLPTFNDKAASRDTAVLLLYQGASRSKGAVDAAIQNFRARVAELNFHSKHIPLVIILSVKAGEADLEKLHEFAQTAKLHTGLPIRLVEATDDSDESLISTVTDVADSLQKHKAQLSGWSRVIEGNVGRRRSQCGSSICAVL